MKKIFGIIKGVISYLLAILLTIVFALFLNANVGWYMLIALILAPVLSVFFALLTKNSVKIDYSLKESTISKDDIVTMTIFISNKNIFPSSPVEFEILNGVGLKSENERITAFVLPFAKKEINIDFQAKIAGKSEIGVKNVRVKDYLGIFAFKKNNYSKTFSVIPDIGSVSAKDERVIKIMQESLSFEDSEDTSECTNMNFSGMPGYDNREYVPGDPIKRINWKQSAKRGRLLVRLDDEMSKSSVNVVLDGCFLKNADILTNKEIKEYYKDYTDEEIFAKLCEDAMENALGILKNLVLLNYNVNFFLKDENEFKVYPIEDESDVWGLRMIMAGYVFSDSAIGRYPDAEMLGDKSFILSTPNHVVSEDFSVISAYDEAIKAAMAMKKTYTAKIVADKKTLREKLISLTYKFAIPYLLALVLSIVAFDAFEIKVLSGWTILQMIAVGLVFALCEFAKKRKFVGFLAVSVTVISCLFIGFNIISPVSEFLKWFMSGGDMVSNTPQYLIFMVLVFTLFFAAVVYFYTKITYRTSVLMLVSMIAFLIHVKVMRDIEIGFVMAVIGLNVMIFILCKDKRGTINKNYSVSHGAVSIVLYMLMFLMLAYAIPKSSDTKYYYLFEKNFLKGNTEIEVPYEYLEYGEISGNADNIQMLNNRKLYEIKVNGEVSLPYLKTGVYDYYDYEIDRWRYFDDYGNSGYRYTNWSENHFCMNYETILEVYRRTEELSPGFLEKYGLTKLVEGDINTNKYSGTVKPWDISSMFYIHPALGWVEPFENENKDNILVSDNDSFFTQNIDKRVNKDYEIMFYDEELLAARWIELGGANMDIDTYYQMLHEIDDVLEMNDDKLLSFVTKLRRDCYKAKVYQQECEENNKLISTEVRKLAEEITADCKYDWEKARAIEEYFSKGFSYDLYYDAKDDSIECFLFEDKKGTCSDFTSAYVVLARAAGLNVRYAEGYVPTKLNTIDKTNEYEIRAKNAHAYPEVYIANLGYIAFEPTTSNIITGNNIQNDNDEGGVVNYVFMLVIRIVVVFVAVSVVILLILFGTGVFGPSIKEKIFLIKVKKCEPEKTVVLIYLRIFRAYFRKYNKEHTGQTPREFGVTFKDKTKMDISDLIFLVEKNSYQNYKISDEERKKAIEIYLIAKKQLRKSK